MANTPNLDLVKPAGTDQALISVLNSNSDKIDTGFGSLSGQIGALNSKIEKHSFGTEIAFSWVNYTVPSDGYAKMVKGDNSVFLVLMVNDKSILYSTVPNQTMSVFVKKGMKVKIAGNDTAGTAVFYPIE